MDPISAMKGIDWFGDFFILRMVPTGLGVYLALKLNDREEGKRDSRRRKALLFALASELHQNAEMIKHVLAELNDPKITSSMDLSVIQSTAWEQVNLIDDAELLLEIQSLRLKLLHISRQLDAQLEIRGEDRVRVLKKLEEFSKKTLPDLEALGRHVQKILDSSKA